MLLQDYLSGSAARNGFKVCAVSGQELITYQELEHFSNQTARMLTVSGVKPRSNVGIFMPKSIPCVAAIFGILKANAAYVPIDSDSPLERISYIIKDCELSVLVTDLNCGKKLIKSHHLFPYHLKLIIITGDLLTGTTTPRSWVWIGKTRIKEQSGNTIGEYQVDENDPAFILYTSGSTGVPKGVMLSHANASAFVDWSQQHLGLNEGDIFSSHAPFHFDLSVFDLFVCFKVTGTLALVPHGISYFPSAVLDFIYKNKISVWYSVPSAIIQLLSLKDDVEKKIKSIQTMIYAGEVFPYFYLNELRKVMSHSNIYNFYGPTETNVITCYKLDLDPEKPLTANVPIGTPCSYANILIVDENGENVETGEIGELIVNGTSLMMGYWGDKAKTRNSIRKISRRHKDSPYYYTGDLVYEDEKGNIVFVNRKDNMVKTRGFRVELGEIETRFYQHPGIYQAAVVAQPDNEIGNRLIGFVKNKTDFDLAIDDIHEFLLEHLPTYMVPEKIIFLDQFPYTSTGKIDRKRLSQMEP